MGVRWILIFFLVASVFWNFAEMSSGKSYIKSNEIRNYVKSIESTITDIETTLDKSEKGYQNSLKLVASIKKNIQKIESLQAEKRNKPGSIEMHSVGMQNRVLASVVEDYRELRKLASQL